MDPRLQLIISAIKESLAEKASPTLISLWFYFIVQMILLTPLTDPPVSQRYNSEHSDFAESILF
jgi:hypothetical protein